MTAIPTVDILGVDVASLTLSDALRHAERLYDSSDPGFVAHVNAHTLNLAWYERDYRAVLRRADLVLNDGKGVMIAARILGTRLQEDLNGNFFGPQLLRLAARRGWPTFFMGAAPGVAADAATRLMARIQGLKVVGTQDGYFTDDGQAIAAVRAARPGLLLVGLGNPLQERWIDRCLPDTGARLAVGVGAFFDFVTGTVPRAPAWMNRVGLEWVHRLALEPGRMWRRYIVGNPLFVVRVLRQRYVATYNPDRAAPPR
jgi:exopolysaccharide biosynthesis WecB/TagA/CpsF family protein